MDALEQSSFYQFLVDKGRQEGREEGRDEGLKAGEQIGGLNEARRLVVLIGRSNLGKIPEVNLGRLNNVTSLEKLEQLLLALNDASSWDALLPGD
jgi:predicted transposase YdaD